MLFLVLVRKRNRPNREEAVEGQYFILFLDNIPLPFIECLLHKVHRLTDLFKYKIQNIKHCREKHRTA